MNTPPTPEERWKQFCFRTNFDEESFVRNITEASQIAADQARREETKDILTQIQILEPLYPEQSSSAFRRIIELLQQRHAPPKPVWCKHCTQNECGRWIYRKTDSCNYLYVPADWDICPIEGCHKPRPQKSK
jgi:hypothetical protein